jgi:transcriptional regulator with XRE-family HTH domain
MSAVTPRALREVLARRGISNEAAAILAGVDPATISRIMNGHVRPRPATVVRLARALGISAKRMQAMCDAIWASAHEGQDEAEWLPVA